MIRSIDLTPCIAGAIAIASGVAPAFAAISQSSISAPGGFVQTAAYSVTNGLPVPGADIGAFGTPQSFEEEAFSGDSSATTAAAYTGPVTVNSATATAGLGVFRAVAANSTLSTEPFPSAQANGGWKESFTVNNPALTGQQGFLTFQVRARGSEQASGISGSALLALAAYKNNVVLTANPYYSPGNSDSVGTSNQYGRWGIATFGNPNTDSRSVDGTVTFSVPITFGQSFTLGVYAFVSAGLRSSGGFGTPCTGRADFSGPGITWNGITGVRNAAGTLVTGSTIVSASGVNWTSPYNPCVADVDDGTATGTPDGGVGLEDLLYYLNIFQQGLIAADLDDGSGNGTRDGGVGIEDLLYYLQRYDAGC